MRALPLPLTVLGSMFLALTAVVASGAARPLDRAGFMALTGLDDPTLTLVSSTATVVGLAEVTGAIALAWALWWAYRGGTSWWTPLGLVAAVVIESVLKATIPQPLPPELHRASLTVPSIHPPFPYAFPSGNVTRVAFLTTLMTLRASGGARRALIAVAVVADALMMATRVYLGEHWPLDVVGGLMLGVAVALATVSISRSPRAEGTR